MIQPLVVCIVLLWLSPMNLFFKAGSWKTQTIILVDEANARHIVEYQIKDKGALGYEKREVEVYYIVRGYVFINIGDYDHRNFMGFRWKTVNEGINEAGLREI